MAFTSIAAVLIALNTGIKYVILRNWQALPEEVDIGGHGDLDMLVEDLKKAEFVLSAIKHFPGEHRVHYKVPILDSSIRADLRYVGDRYYHPKWEKDILQRRILNPKGFYTPSDEDHFYTLLYHGACHKSWQWPRAEYVKVLLELAPGLGLKVTAQSLAQTSTIGTLLNNYMKKHGYGFADPIDRTVPCRRY